MPPARSCFFESGRQAPHKAPRLKRCPTAPGNLEQPTHGRNRHKDRAQDFGSLLAPLLLVLRRLPHTALTRCIGAMVPLAARIGKIDWVVFDIGIEVDPALIPDRIGLHEPPEHGRVDAGLVIIHAELADPGLAGILEPAGIARLGDAPRIVGVDGEDGARRVGHRDDRALAVGREPAAVAGEIGALVPDERLVDPGAVQVAAKQRAGAVIFGDQRVAVVEELGGARASARRLEQPPELKLRNLSLLGQGRMNNLSKPHS